VGRIKTTDAERNRLTDGINANLLFLSGLVFKLHNTRNYRKNGVIAPESDILPGMKMGAALTDEDLPGLDGLTTVPLDAKSLADTVPAV
jgi:hypothetical protein